jgi:hypothetical protein
MKPDPHNSISTRRAGCYAAPLSHKKVYSSLPLTLGRRDGKVATTTLIYLIEEIPDLGAPKNQLAAGGDVSEAVARAAQELQRAVADCPTGKVTATLRYLYSPEKGAANPQARLSLYLIIKSRSKARARSLAVRIERGPLSLFYKLKLAPINDAPWEELKAVCHVVRQESAISPLYGPEFNPAIPEKYYLVNPFKPCSTPSFTSLDRVMDSITEPAVIDIAIAAADVSEELQAYTKYLERLHTINWPTRLDWDDEPAELDFVGDERPAFHDSRPARRPAPKKDPTAEDVLKISRQYVESLRKRNLFFNIRAMASTPEDAELLASVLAESVFDEGTYRILSFDNSHPAANDAILCARENRIAQVPSFEKLFPDGVPKLYIPFESLSNLATVEELQGAFCPPMGGYETSRTIRKDTDPKLEKVEDLIVLGYDAQLGISDGKGDSINGLPRGIRVDNLVKHMFVTGIPGMGKTSVMLNMVHQLWERRIPTLVLEAVKTEYRALAMLKDHENPALQELGRNIRCFTPGDERLVPYRYNPFILPKNANLDQRIQGILRSFKAGMALHGPLLPLLMESVYKLTDDFKDSMVAPTMDDLAETAEKTLLAKDYGGETESDILGALRVRFAGLTIGNSGKIFRCNENVPAIADLFEAPHIIEFDAIEPEQASLATMGLLREIRDHVRDEPFSDGPPRLVIIVEEAHLLAGRSQASTSSSEFDPDPRAFGSEYIVRMLAECRALGIGMIICDQLPSAVAPEVVKNTGSTICLKQKDKEEREVMSSAMLLGPMEEEELVRFLPGDAFLMTEGYQLPRHVKLFNTKKELGIKNPPLGTRILEYIEDEPWFIKAGGDRLKGEFDIIERGIYMVETMQNHAFDEFMALTKQLESFKESAISSDSLIRRSREMTVKAKTLRTQFEKARELLECRACRLSIDGHDLKNESQEFLARRERLVERFESLKEVRRQHSKLIDEFLDKLP